MQLPSRKSHLPALPRLHFQLLQFSLQAPLEHQTLQYQTGPIRMQLAWKPIEGERHSKVSGSYEGKFALNQQNQDLDWVHKRTMPRMNLCSTSDPCLYCGINQTTTAGMTPFSPVVPAAWNSLPKWAPTVTFFRGSVNASTKMRRAECFEKLHTGGVVTARELGKRAFKVFNCRRVF